MRITLHVHRGIVLLNELAVDHTRVPVATGEAVTELRQWAAVNRVDPTPAALLLAGSPAIDTTRLTPAAEDWLSERTRA